MSSKIHEMKLGLERKFRRLLIQVVLGFSLVYGLLGFVGLFQGLYDVLHQELITVEALERESPEILTKYLESIQGWAIFHRHNGKDHITGDGAQWADLATQEFDEGTGLHVLVHGRSPKLVLVRQEEDHLWMVARARSNFWPVALLVCLLLLGLVLLALSSRNFFRVIAQPVDRQLKFYEELGAAKLAFFAGILHELGTPLTSLMSRLEMLRDRISPAHRKEVDKAYLDAMRMSQITNNQLLSARLETQSLEIRRSHIHVYDLLEAVALRLELFLASKDKELLWYCDEQLQVWADRLKLEHALINLITNAAKYAPEGKNIGLRASEGANSWIFEVEDAGNGFGPDALEQWLAPFRSSHRSEQPSHGLGLFLVHEMVSVQMGTVRVVQKRPGFVVQISLPKLQE